YEVGLAQSEEPLWIEADGVRLRQTLTHLLTTVAGCVPSPGRIDIVTGRSGGTAFVEVRDNGAGIPDDLLARVSPSFTYQSQLKGRGRSVRLAVATRIVELHGGSLELTRVEGEGTRFTVRLPLDPEAGSEAGGEVSNALSASGPRPRVL